jgi:Domain of unknown function (DUF3303)
MLFVAEYTFDWQALETVVAKRIEWDDVSPAGFRFVGEYVWKEGDPPFRGVVIIDAESIEDLNAFVLHYGPTLTMRVHPASDVASGIAMISGGGATRRARAKKRRR